ncbi:MAG TPA: hypothetical protein VMZ28_15180, partial [Kofleriaceae bacterium]|nr:hypothetical protein [Kofleriaceae bacterium]
RDANGVTAALRGLACGPDASDAMARHLLATCGTLPLRSVQELGCKCWPGTGAGPVCEMRAIGQCGAAPVATGWAPPPRALGIAMFRSMFGVRCGDYEGRVVQLLGPPSSRVAAGARAVLQYGGVSLQIVAATGRVAYISVAQSPTQPLDARFSGEPKLRYLGWPAASVMQEIGAPMAPGDAVMYQDQSAQVMVSFYCPQRGPCTNIGIYCLGE